MTSGRRLVNAGLGLTLAMVLLLARANAQEDSASALTKSQPATETIPGARVEGAPVEEAVDATPAPGAPNPYAGVIRNAGTGLPILGAPASPLRWGDFSIDRFEYIGVHDEFVPRGPVPSVQADLSIVRAGLMFDHYFRKAKSRIVLQYLPQLVIINGQLRTTNGANNNVSVGTTFHITPRLSLTLQDGFLQVQSNQTVPANYLNADAEEGAIVQNTFLDTNGSFLSDTATAIVQYDLSARTTLTVSPSYRYAKATNNLPTYVANGDLYQGVATLGHTLSPRSTIGMIDSYQLLEQQTLGAAKIPAHFNTAGFFYSERLARSLWVAGQVGAESESYADLPAANHWGFGAGFSIIDAFSERAGFSLAYTRGVTLANFITNRNADHVDFSFGLKPVSRVTLNTGVGYYREFGVLP